MKLRTILGMATAVLLLVPFGSATAHPDHRVARAEDSAPAHQHGSDVGHLPGSSENVELLGELEPTKGQGPIVEGQIADLAVYNDYAYLNSWDEPTCTKGGFYVVDIRDPRKPIEGDFMPALPGNYHGEGAHVITVKAQGKGFKGDILAVNNEFCSSLETEPTAGAGFDLYDVSNPRNPKVLVQGAGDRGADDGSMTGDFELANSYHSVFMWQDDGRVYLVATDNFEFHDVDIFDITDPKNPIGVAEYDMVEEFPQILEEPAPRGDNVFNHDMIVKEINGRDVLLDSYWDGGYLLIDIEDPANPIYIGDSDFGPVDPLTGVMPPEGNAHQAEFSHNNQYFLAADEDFNPYRSDKFYVYDEEPTTPEDEREASEVGGGLSPASLPDQTLSGKVVYGGYGCPADDTVIPLASAYDDELDPEAGDEKILLMQRGPTGDPSADYNGNGNLTDDACFPGEKAAKAFDAGWDAIVLVNRHTAGGAAGDEAFCGSGAYDPDKPMVTVCTTHGAYHELFGSAPDYTIPYPSTDAPAIGEVSDERVKATSLFDGWGYAHLYEREAGKVTRLDSYAIEESLDPDYAFGFGDLSIHEFATDPNQNRAYISYYSGGVRVVDFGPDGIEEVGHYIDDEGNNFWGIETFVPSIGKAGDLRGQRLFAGSDRDHGIFIFRYTGN